MTATTMPDMSLEQRRAALKIANDVRSRRAQLKRDLKAGACAVGGRPGVRELLLDPPRFLATAKVFDLLMAMPAYGRVKVSKILWRCEISPSKTVGGLTTRQRAAVCSELDRIGRRPRR